MPKKKIYDVSFYVDLHAVTSPGVWLCPKGKVSVRVSLFGVSELTKRLPPIFPLLFHERFHFQKLFKKVGCLPLLEAKLTKLPICLDLLQFPECTVECVKLALFKATLGDLLFPPAGGDFNLMFTPTKSYPGIIAPIAEVSTRLALQESEIEVGSPVLPMTIFSKGSKERQKGVVRQKAVCHTKHNLYCGCFAHAPPRKIVAPTNKRQKSGGWTQKKLPSSMKYDKYNQKESEINATSGTSTDHSGCLLNCGCGNKEKYRPPETFIQDRYLQNVPLGNFEKNSTPNDICDEFFQKQKNITQKRNSARSPQEKNFNYNCEDYFNATLKNEGFEKPPSRNNQEILELKQQLKALIEENKELERQIISSSHKKKMCCPCCPKEQYLTDLVKDGHKCPSEKPEKDITPSCSACSDISSRKALLIKSDTTTQTLVEDMRKRPLFYSNLYKAYENLQKKKKNKKPPVWR